MSDKEYQKFIKRYDKFKDNNLPTPFWDEERQVKEFIYFDNGHTLLNPKSNHKCLNVNSTLTEALGDIAFTNFYYPFIDKHNFNHAHSFEEVVNALYLSPETFKIDKKAQKYYSAQELEYLQRVQKYLLFIGLKDIDNFKISEKRYQNKIQQKYENALIYKFDDNTLKKVLNGKLNFRIIKWYQKAQLKYYQEGEFQALIVDKNDNFKLFIEFTYEEVKKYKDIKKFYPKQNLKDNSKVIAMYFKILETFN